MTLNTLLQDLNSPDAKTRIRAIYQLGILGDPSAAAALRQVVENDSVKEVRVTAKAAVGHIQMTHQANRHQDADADVRFTRQFTQYLERSRRFSAQDIQDLALQAAQSALHTFQQPDNAIPRPVTPAEEEANSSSSASVPTTPSTPGTHVVGTYEMLWDCEYCGTKKLLGVTHRHCPNCGAAQNAEGRYFPAPGEEVALENHEYVGVDIICPSCEQPNSAAATYCVNCGTPMSEGTAAPMQETQYEGGFEESRRDLVKEQFLADQAQVQALPAAPKRQAARNRRKVWLGSGIGAILLLMSSVFGIFFYKQNELVTVQNHEWVHLYQIEEYQVHRETRDCPAPAGAYDISRRTEQRSRQVPDGQDCKQVCTNRRVDQGDGSFRTERDCRQECTTRYRTEYYNVQVCTYDINRWTDLDEQEEAPWAVASGTNTEPYWPDVENRVPSCSNAPDTIGQECWKEREATYTLNLLRDNGKVVTCDVGSMNEWLSYQDNQSVRVQFTQWSKWRNKALCDNIEVVE